VKQIIPPTNEQVTGLQSQSWSLRYIARFWWAPNFYLFYFYLFIYYRTQHNTSNIKSRIQWKLLSS